MGQIPKDLLCQCCEDLQAVTFRYGQKLCADCLEVKERMENSQKATSNNQRMVVPGNPILSHAAAIDASVAVKTDIFNAETVAISELKAAIDADESIPADKKQFALATALQNRIQGFKKAIFDLQQQVVDESNKQRAVQQYMNQLANSLREEEREKIKSLDVTYKPTSTIHMTKGIKKSKINTIAKVLKVTNEELAIASKELGGMEPSTIKMYCAVKGWDIATATRELKAVIEAGKAAQQKQ